jgi:phage terminase large subunit-like protein
MWLHRFTDYILQHRLKAMLFTFVITFVPVIGLVGILIAALVTLVKGVVEGAIFTAAATLPFIISFCLSGTSGAETPLVVWAAVGVAVLSNVLTWVFAVMLRRQTSWSLILQIAALLGVLAVSVVHLAYPGVIDWWGIQLQSYYNQAAAITTSVLNNSPPAAVPPNEVQLESITVTKQYATGLMVAAVLFNAILQLVVARWWQVLVFTPGMLRKELHRIRLSQLAGVLFVGSLVLAYLGNAVVLDIMPILYLLFGAAGLSLVHYLFGLMNSKTTWFWLSLLYIALVIALPTSVLVVAFLALLDIWLDVRKRIQKV